MLINFFGKILTDFFKRLNCRIKGDKKWKCGIFFVKLYFLKNKNSKDKTENKEKKGCPQFHVEFYICGKVKVNKKMYC